MRRPWLAATAALVFAGAAAVPVDRAVAQCAPPGTGGPDNITCTGTVAANFNAGNGADVINFGPGIVVVNGGVTINGQGGADTFNILSGATVNNSGDI